jgi:hypothetical protein
VRLPGRTATGLALGAAGMLYSRLSGRRPQQEQPKEQQEPQAQEQQTPTPPPEVSRGEVERAKSELADELARRAGGTFPT